MNALNMRRLAEYRKKHTSSCTVTPLLEPMDAVFLSILVEQEKETKLLQEAVS